MGNSIGDNSIGILGVNANGQTTASSNKQVSKSKKIKLNKFS